MYPNTLRPAVKHGPEDVLRALLPIEGAVRTAKYERPCQLAFVEDGVRLLQQPIQGDLAAPGWSSLGELLDEVTRLSLPIFACLDCAEHRGVVASGESPTTVQWLPSTDIRFPLHLCRGEVKRMQLVTLSLQRRAQEDFDDRVGKRTTGAY